MEMNRPQVHQFGDLIREHRETVGMKVSQLAKAIGVNRNTIANYEAGRTAPSVTDLVRIARALGCTIVDLTAMEPRHSVVRFAFRAHTRLANDPGIQVIARRFLRSYREIEDIMGVKMEARLPNESFDPREVPPERWIPTAAARCRDLLGIRFFSPGQLALLLEGLGVRTLFFDFEGKGLDGISAIEGDMSLVMLHRRRRALERTISSAAHELGHLVLHPQMFTETAVGDKSIGRDYESEAKLFARHLLVPTDDLLQTWRDERLSKLPVEHALLLLKRVFRVSYWLLFHRLRDEGLTEKGHAQLVNATKRLLDLTGRVRMDDLEPEPMTETDTGISTRFHSLIRSAFLQERIGVAKTAELLQVTIDRAKEITFQWMTPRHELVE